MKLDYPSVFPSYSASYTSEYALLGACIELCKPFGVIEYGLLAALVPVYIISLDRVFYCLYSHYCIEKYIGDAMDLSILRGIGPIWLGRAYEYHEVAITKDAYS